MSKGMCEFQSGRMKKEEYSWFRPGVDKYHVKCEVCKKEFSVSWVVNLQSKNIMGVINTQKI